MKLGSEQLDLDAIDHHILMVLQENCKTPLAKIGDKVGLSAPAVMERIKKLEDSGVVTGYVGILDARKLGFDITAFIGVSIGHPKTIARFEREIDGISDVLECHHVTGSHTLLLKVKTVNTSSLETLISRLRSIEGVVRTETMVVLSTHSERTLITLPNGNSTAPRRPRRNGERVDAEAG